MKKLAVAWLVVFMFSGTAFAQNKPDKGSFGMEVQFNPFDQDGNTFQLDGLKFRYFITDKDAVRLKFGIKSKHDSYTDAGKEDYTNQVRTFNNKFNYTVGDFKFDVGYERHFDLAKRLNMYVGASIGVTKHFASTSIKSLSESVSYGGNGLGASTWRSSFSGKIKNGAITEMPESLNWKDLLKNVNDQASVELNAAVFTGLDFYVYKGLFVGMELGLKVESSKSRKMKYSGKRSNIDSHNVPETIEYSTESAYRKRITEVNTYIEPVLRLGWNF